MRTVANQLGVALHRIRIYQELEQALVTTLTVLGAAMEVRDAYTALHEEAVADLAVGIAAELGLDPVRAAHDPLRGADPRPRQALGPQRDPAQAGPARATRSGRS